MVMLGKDNKTLLTSINASLAGIDNKIPSGYTEDIIRFTVANVGSSMVAQQMTGMHSGTGYIIKDVEVYFSGTAQVDAYMDLNIASTDVAATKLAGRYYQTGSFINFIGNNNGNIGGDVATKPYLQLCAGASAVGTQTVYVTLRYYWI